MGVRGAIVDLLHHDGALADLAGCHRYPGYAVAPPPEVVLFPDAQREAERVVRTPFIQ